MSKTKRGPRVSVRPQPRAPRKPPKVLPGKPDPTKPGKRPPAKGDPAYNPDVRHPPNNPNRPLPQR